MGLLELYLLFVLLPGLGHALTAVCVLGLFIYGTTMFFAGVAGDLNHDDVTYYIKPIFKKWVIVVLVLCGVMGSALPNKKDMIVLTGAYVVTNQAEMAKLPNNVLKAANAYLEKLQDSLKDSEKKAKK